MTEELKILITARDEASKTLGRLGGALKTGLAVGAAAAAAGVVVVGAALADCVREAMAAEEIQTRLNSVLASTKGVSGMTAESINALATSLSEVTRFEDDAIVSGQNMLLTFTNIGKDVFPNATEAMLNLSSAMGTDLQSSSILVGKALNDPIAGLTSLTRAGVQFTDAQKETIKALMETGDVAGAQKIILGELETQFGGAARAAGGTLAGQLDILKNQFGNVKEEIGAALIPIITELVVKYGPQMVEFAKVIAKWMVDTLVPALKAVGAWLGENLPPVIAALAVIWETVLLPSIKLVWQLIDEYVIPALKILFAWIAENLPPAIAKLTDFWNTKLYPAIKAIYDFVTDSLIPGFKNLVTFLGGTLTTALNAIRGVFDTVRGAVDTVRGVIEGFIGKVQDALEWIGKLLQKVGLLPKVTGLGGAGANASGFGGLPFLGNQGAQLAYAGADMAFATQRQEARPSTQNYTFNVTINAPNTEPRTIEQAAREGVLSAARALGVR